MTIIGTAPDQIPVNGLLGTAAFVDVDHITSPVMTATTKGLVPTPPNNTIAFLRGDGTFADPVTVIQWDITIHGVTVGKGVGTATDYNTVLGDAAGGANTTGDFNTFIGYSAGAANTSGRRNSAFGSWALQSNTTGIRNSAQGSFALGQNTEGNQNTSVGETSGGNLGAIAGSDNNTTVGYGAGGPCGLGAIDPQVVAGNTYIGCRANGAADGNNTYLASCNTSGDNNTFLGYLTMGATAADSNEIVIGANGVGLGSNTTVIGNSSTTGTYVWGALRTKSTATIGYDAGGLVAQATSRLTGVTLSKPTGKITLFSTTTTAGQVTTFTLTNTLITADDAIIISQRSGAGVYFATASAVAAGSCKISVHTPAAVGTAEAPVFNFAIVKGAAA